MPSTDSSSLDAPVSISRRPNSGTGHYQEGQMIPNKVFVRYVPDLFTHLDICRIFRDYGTILKCELLPPAPHNAGYNGGSAFILYETIAEAEAAISALNGLVVPNVDQNDGTFRPKELQVMTARQRGPGIKDAKIIIRGMPEDWRTKQAIVTFFQQFGQIEACDLINTENYAKYPMAFVTFNLRKSAEAAVLSCQTLHPNPTSGVPAGLVVTHSRKWAPKTRHGR
ncbi:hypothetical protein BV898_10148 [Hypsibius exemplaris]|uniref:RRM domain-containing protein n=1 Tax=Hypsibius exemplaris TaxID=2072580 RepID=A0A1W0WKH5_HYPEX|nr:hypothetical protein BV898_10148 [Hypsibius exemplaris]